ncbi:MAG: N-acetylmuramoyl-L-alanine amidase, family 2 [Ilumatobacteraceae bacterium]|nr:N-acetylmuramoyl-L-alanine amidase, family 2 [Ilumatobacteraceae bacterium]
MLRGTRLRRTTAAVGGVLAVALVGLVPNGAAHATSPATGNFDRLHGAGDGVNWAVTGWAVDLDTPTTPVTVSVSIDGSSVKSATASEARDDVAARYPTVGADHGYTLMIPIPAVAGTHYVCVYATDTDGSGATSLIGCKTGFSAGIVTAPTTTPTTTPTASTTPTTAAPTTTVAALPPNRPASGFFDRLFGSTAAHTWTMTGWAVDLDTPGAAVAVNVYVDGVIVSTSSANGSRPDVAARYPFVGDAHGYAITLPMPAAGLHFVCIGAVDTGTNTSSLIGCRFGVSS